MALVLDGTTGVSGVDGSASTPALQGTDTNTGVTFPAADTVGISTGGSERVRVNSSGNVGIGTASPDALFTVNTVASFGDGSASAPSIAHKGDLNTGIYFSAADTVDIATGGTQRVTVDSSGNVGIGTSSPAAKVHALGNGTANIPTIIANSNRSGTNAGVFSSYGYNASIVEKEYGRLYSTIDTNTAGSEAGSMVFQTINAGTLAERARITSGGEVYIAGTTDQGAYNLQCNGTGVWGAGAYVNGSDARIKDDVQPISPSLGVVEKLNPVTFRYKESWSKDQSIQAGFIAQELLTALTGEVYVDGVVSQGGSEGYYSVAYQALIPVLTKAIQEQQAMIQELQAKVQALENK